MSKVEGLLNLQKAGFRVPKFLVCNGTLDDKIIDQLDNSKTYAIRSSANVEDGSQNSFAGLFETYLNVSRDCINDCINRCIEAGKKNQIKKYMEEQRIVSSVEMQVVVQEMIPSEVSGVCFSKNPISGDGNVIECVWGIGEGLVSGKYAPDYIECDSQGEIIRYKVAFQSSQIALNKNSGLIETDVPLLMQSSKKLDSAFVKEITISAKSIERVFGYPIDIEWCIRKGFVYYLQMRPITGLGN